MKDWVLRKRWLKELAMGAEKSRIEGCSVVAWVKVAERKLQMIQNKFHRIENLLKDNVDGR